MESIAADLERIIGPVAVYLPRFLLAVAILVVGWLIARIAAWSVRKALDRTELDNRIADWISSREGDEKLEIEYWVGRSVFFLLMLFVLVAFFQVLGLAAITEPLNRFLNELFGFAPRLLGPLVLLVIAWVVARALRFLVRQGLEKANLDQRFSDSAGADPEKSLPLSQTLSEAVYWLVFLLFLPGILGPLGLTGLLTPVQNLVDQLLGFLPQLLAALVILGVGWFVARIVQRIVSSLLAAVGVDRVGEGMGLDQALGEQKLSGLLGTVVYVLILIPVLIASLDALAVEAITRPASAMLNTILQALPNIFAAILVLVIAYLVAKVVAGLATNLLTAAGFNKILSTIGLGREPGEGERTPSEMVGHLLVVAVMFFAATEAARLLGFEVVRELASQFLVFAGRILLGLIIFGVGLYLANLASSAVRSSRAAEAGLLAMATRIAILVLGGAMALRQMGLANEIINLAFGLTVGAIAVALAIAFGLGGRETAARQLEAWNQKVKTRPPDRDN